VSLEERSKWGDVTHIASSLEELTNDASSAHFICGIGAFLGISPILSSYLLLSSFSDFFEEQSLGLHVLLFVV